MVYDAIIIGSGGAALSAAIAIKENKKDVLIITKSSSTSAQTSQAQGGINGVMDYRDDSVENHILDTLQSAHNIGDKDMISFMCHKAQDTIYWLDSLGVPFNRDLEKRIDARKLGGATAPRANYSSDYTGLKIVQTLYDKVITLGIPIIEDSMLLSLLKSDENSVCGVSVLDIKTTQVRQYIAQNVILASGGYGGVYHNFTTNSADTTGDGIRVAYKAGAQLENMEMVQFHPTALKEKYILISESARGEGGYLVTKDEKRFVDELLPRDIVARKIYEKILNGENIYLDVRHLGLDKILHLMPQEYKLTLDYLSLKMDKDLVPIVPAVHYSMGGIKVNKESRTSLNNLYAIGECCSNGVHGANRLGGNSLLEIIVFGRDIVNHLNYNKIIEDKEYQEYRDDKIKINKLLHHNGESFYQDRKRLGEILYFNGGVFREENGLKSALIEIDDLLNSFNKYGLEDKSTLFNLNLKHLLEFDNMIHIAKNIFESALLREESRGAHCRSDFPLESEKSYNIIVDIRKGYEKLWF